MHKEKIEKLADQAHKSWSGWMEYLFNKSVCHSDGSVTIPRDLVERWDRQLKTDYKDLSEKEKESDREEARKYLELIED